MTTDLRTLIENATEGPWEAVPGFGTTSIYGRDAFAGEFIARNVRINDAKLILSAVNALPGLLDAVEARPARRVRPFKPEARLRLRPGNIEHLTVSADLDFIDTNGHTTPYMRGGYYA